MNRSLTARLAAHGGIRNIEAILRADETANAADRAVARFWTCLLRILRNTTHHFDAYQQSVRHCRLLLPSVQTALATSLRRTAVWGHKATATTLARALPREYLAVAALRKHRRLTEAVDPAKVSGSIELKLDKGHLTVKDKAGRLREPARNLLSTDEQFELFFDLLFPPPSESTLNRIVYGTLQGQTWVERLQGATRFATPEQLATTIMHGYLAGKDQRGIAKDLLPVVSNIRSTARRIARTEGIRVAGEIQMEMHEQLGDLAIGYQIHATLDQHTRPWHRHRSGEIYYKHPKAGQKGLAQMPRPPMEAEDASERPAGTPQEAWNCRCVIGSACIHADARSITRAFYNGEAIELWTRLGARLTVTANHPIATPDGFFPASHLRKGDYLISDGLHLTKRFDHVQNRPSAIENIFEALASKNYLSRRQGPNALEFHGDGKAMYGQVDIVGTNPSLMFNRNPAFVQGQKEQKFVGRASRAMNRLHKFSSFIFGHPGPFQGFSLRTSTQSYSGAFEHSDYSAGSATSMNSSARDPECFRELIDGFSREVSSDQIGWSLFGLGKQDRFRFSTKLHPALYEPSANRASLHVARPSNLGAGFSTNVSRSEIIGDLIAMSDSDAFASCPETDTSFQQDPTNDFPRHAKFIDELRNRCSRFIQPDKVIFVRHFHLRAPVYSIDTGLGYYMGSDNMGPAVVQGNCFLAPVLASPNEASAPNPKIFRQAEKKLVPNPAVYSDWFAQVDERRQRLAVGTRRYSAAAETLGQEPSYEHFIDPETGDLLTVSQLRHERPASREKRLARVRHEVAKHREAIAQVAMFGHG